MTSPTPKISISVLGAAGLIGLRHVDCIQNNPDCELHSIIDPTQAGTQLATKLQVPHFCSLQQFFSECKSTSSSLGLPTCAIVATPSSMHVAQSQELISEGIHILVEKPLASTSQEALPLIPISKLKDSGTILVGFHRRFNPYIVNFKKILDSQALGKIVSISTIWCVRKPISYFKEAKWRQTKEGGGGVILTNLSHEVDLLRFLFGDITRVYCELGAKERGFEVEESGAVTLKFKSGAVGSLIFSDAALSPFSFEGATGENPHLPASHKTIYTVCGTKGALTFPELTRFHGKEEESDWTKPLLQDRSLSLPFEAPYASDTGPEAPFPKRLEHWVRTLRGEEEVNCSLSDGIQSARILEALLESAETGKAVEIDSSM